MHTKFGGIATSIQSKEILCLILFRTFAGDVRDITILEIIP